MPGKRHSPAQILRKLREVEVNLARGETVSQADRGNRAAYYRWRNEYGGLSIDQARKLKKGDSYLSLSTNFAREITG